MVSNCVRKIVAILSFAAMCIFLLGTIWLCGRQLRPTVDSTSLAPSTSKAPGASGSPVSDADMEISSSIFITPVAKLWNVGDLSWRQESLTKTLLAQGRYEMALAAAKCNYDIADLGKTQDAVKLMAAVLVKSRGGKAADAFRKGQFAYTAPLWRAGAIHGREGILQTIRIESSAYDQAIRDLKDKTEDTGCQLEAGNLLLLVDRPTDARGCFDLALLDAARSRNTRDAIVALNGIARAIRDQDGSVLRADAFVVSMRARAIVDATTVGSLRVSMPVTIHAAAAQLNPSGIFYGMWDLAWYESPEDPYSKAAKDPKLACWLFEWQRTPVDGAALMDRRAELQQILKATPLSCLALSDIGRAISIQSRDDWTEATIYAAAILHGNNELAGFAVGAKEARPIIEALLSIRSRLWTIVDSGDRTFFDALYAVNSNLIQWIPANDGTLRDVRTHGFIDVAECLWAMGRTDDAVAAAESIDTSSMARQEMANVAWIRGLAFYSKGRYSDAVPQFQTVLKSNCTDEASRFLILSLARSGRTDEANVRLDDWVRRYHPKVDQVASMLARMAGSR